MQKLHALVLGASGATGKEIVKLLLRSSDFIKVSLFVRRPFDIKHNKLSIHQIDFSRLHDYKALIKGDVLFSSLGTTRKEAGGKIRQYLVDFTYQYDFAKIASENRVSQYFLVSSLGANKKSFFFYPKIKGDLEEAVKLLSFQKIHIFQPPSLIRPLHMIRFSEKISLKFLSFVNKFGLLISFRPLSVYDLALKMISMVNSNNIKKICIYRYNDFTSED
ncbi:MAG: semialdehyde dehydrogenase [Flavobacteriales bacterium TMED191]|nr:MAG: semialdehyde dehydrogenase [Flavobacteriales bacterium TMED191]|tara:strand:- start:1494 stop:2150 length:657 start_codon:yes stop_codon:yes gene_type:complete